MARGRPPKPLELADGDKEAPEALVANPSAPNREVQRARVLLLAAEGRGSGEIAEIVGVVLGTVSHLKRKYRERGFHAVTDAPRSGRPRW